MRANRGFAALSSCWIGTDAAMKNAFTTSDSRSSLKNSTDMDCDGDRLENGFMPIARSRASVQPFGGG